MKKISRLLIASMLVFSMAACGDKEEITPNDNNNPTTPETPESTIKTGRLTNGNITINGEQRSNAFGIDFDNDGELEFSIGGEETFVYFAYDYQSQNNIVNIEEQWDYIEPLASNTVINEQSRFEGQGDAYFSDQQSLPEHFYIGFRIKKADGFHYGWLSAQCTAGVIQWGSCAYNTKPNTEIKAGEL